MKENRITSFDIKICFSQRHNLKFCVIAPNGFEHEDVARISDNIDIFINYNLAIRPNVPVILFELENKMNCGAKLYKHQGLSIYHLPPMRYATLEESIKESFFIISDALLIKLIDGKFHTSIIDFLPDIQASTGLNVLGYMNETEKSEIPKL